jgi:hypothetical protein
VSADVPDVVMLQVTQWSKSGTDLTQFFLDKINDIVSARQRAMSHNRARSVSSEVMALGA